MLEYTAGIPISSVLKQNLEPHYTYLHLNFFSFAVQSMYYVNLGNAFLKKTYLPSNPPT